MAGTPEGRGWGIFMGLRAAGRCKPQVPFLRLGVCVAAQRAFPDLHSPNPAPSIPIPDHTATTGGGSHGTMGHRRHWSYGWVRLRGGPMWSALTLTGGDSSPDAPRQPTLPALSWLDCSGRWEAERALYDGRDGRPPCGCVGMQRVWGQTERIAGG